MSRERKNPSFDNDAEARGRVTIVVALAVVFLAGLALIIAGIVN